MTNQSREELLECARTVMRNAYSPHSNFQVGAAVRTRDGKIFTGCNIENISFGLTICAERVAIFTAISAGYSDFDEMAISSSGKTPTYPCGACRQVIIEFDKDRTMKIYIDKDEKSYNISDFLPHSFSKIPLD